MTLPAAAGRRRAHRHRQSFRIRSEPNGIDHSFVSAGLGRCVLIDATAGAIAPLLDNNLSNNTGFGLHNLSAGSITAINNYWGSNLGRFVAAEVSGPLPSIRGSASLTDVSISPGFQPFSTRQLPQPPTSPHSPAPRQPTSALSRHKSVTLTMDGDTGFVHSRSF